MHVTIVKFPGSGGADDAEYVFSRILGVETTVLWHDEENIGDTDLLVLPGGYSFGDYLRPGCLARSSAIAPAIRRFSRTGRVLGIGNGFQVLCELEVLPGILLPNVRLELCSEPVHLKVEKSICGLCGGLEEGKVFQLPLACSFGCYFADYRTLVDLQEKGLVALRYCDENGEVTEECNPTGSASAIAGVTNVRGNVLGLMAHPERAVEPQFGGTDGLEILRAVLGSASAGNTALPAEEAD